VTIFSYGILPRAGLEKLRQPSMAGVMEAVVGHWGDAFISVGVIVSVLGAYLAWTMMAAEVLYVAAKERTCRRSCAAPAARTSPCQRSS
jgi:arginine:ornithine antiporter / lysine permease